MNYCVVFVTAPKGKQGPELAQVLLKKRLCACVNIIKSVESFFWWKSKINKAGESLLMIKTKKSLLKQLIKTVREKHSYQVCETIALPIIAGNKPYLDWIEAEC
ncbi:MAG: divalent-cation tolerance protein CutA [Candidatus Omnitrophota bacterium]